MIATCWVPCCCFIRRCRSCTPPTARPILSLLGCAADDTTGEFKLRPGVRFHDGTPLTAADIEFSIARPATIVNSPSSYTLYTKSIKSVEAIDPTTIRIRTNGPYPLLPADLSNISISPRPAAAGQ